MHDVGGGAVFLEEFSHGAHVGIDVGEEGFVGGAEVVEAGVAVGGEDEAVLGAFAVAGEADFAVTAVFWEGVGFVVAKFGLGGGVGHLLEGSVEDVAEVIAGVDVVVAGIEIAVVFDGECGAAFFGEDAEGGTEAEPVSEGDVEELDEGFADVVADPVVEDDGEESAVVLREDAGGGDGGIVGNGW